MAEAKYRYVQIIVTYIYTDVNGFLSYWLLNLLIRSDYLQLIDSIWQHFI